MLGREIETLVDKYQVTGDYTITFDAKHLSSGIYFYKIQTGNPSKDSKQRFVETKKMIFIR